MFVARLDDIAADLLCEATRIAGDAGSALYDFALRARSGRCCVAGPRSCSTRTAPA